MMLIAEDLLLLCFNDEIGNQLQLSTMNEALGAALLAEVDLTGALRLVKPGRFRAALVQIAEGTPTPSDPLLGRALAAVAEADRSSWDLVKLIGTKALKQELLEPARRPRDPPQRQEEGAGIGDDQPLARR